VSSPFAALRVTLACCLLGCVATNAQENVPPAEPSVSPPSAPALKSTSHPFWDKSNVGLFVGVAASRTLDYASTRHFRARGLSEWLLTNAIVDNKTLFQAIEAAGVAVSIGVSYLLHRTHHHKLERWASVLHIGVTVGGAIHNYTLSKPSPPRGTR
jgi:hypothetical protein